MWETLDTVAAVELEASIGNFSAAAALVEVVTTFTGIATVIIVTLAIGNHALVVLEKEGFEAFSAAVV